MLQDYITHVIVVASVDVHLAKAEEGQHKTARGELCRLVVVLKSLIIIFLDVECSSQLVAALSSHGFILCVVEGMESQVLDLLVVLKMRREHTVQGIAGRLALQQLL